MDLGLTDRVFLVSGASGGLGRATAEQLVAEGARVVLVARRAEVLAELAGQLGADQAVWLAADVGEPDTATRAAELALQTWGRLDGALVSVGGPPAGAALDLADEVWTAAFQSVFLAALRMTRAVITHATTSDVSAAWVLSTSVRSPIPGLATSNGLRPGLAMLLKQLADELGPQGTRLVGLLPGRVETDRTRQLDERADDPAAARAASENGIPLRRYGTPAEFARVATFLLSPAASYVSGCVVPVDGGALRAL